VTAGKKPTADQRRKAAQSYPHGGGANDSCLMLLAFPALLGFTLVYILGQLGLVWLLP
jgi:hypothetical protein